MTILKSKLGILALVGILFLSGCTKLDGNTTDQEDPTTMPGVVEPGEETPSDDDSGETTLRGAEFPAKIDGIESIVLKDVEGNVIDRTFTDEEMAEIEAAFNDSYIMDTAYIEMIAGYNMTILLDNGEEVFITSYGDPVFIVATMSDGETYHLGNETIATILLEGMN